MRKKDASEKDEAARYARLRYEHLTSEARHVRDMALSKAWIEFERSMASAWEPYNKAMAAYEDEQAFLLEDAGR